MMWEVPSWSLIARFMGPTWGPPGADRIQVGPMLAPWTLLSGMPPWLMTDHPTLLVWLGLGLLIVHSGGSVQKRRNPSALAMELHLSCTASIWSLFYFSCTSIFLMQFCHTTLCYKGRMVYLFCDSLYIWAPMCAYTICLTIQYLHMVQLAKYICIENILYDSVAISHLLSCVIHI